MRAVRSRNVSESRTASSSSMTWTRLVDCIAEILVRYPWHREAKHRATPLVRLHGDLAAVVFDDRARDRQADSHPVALGRHERMKELRRNLRRDAGAAVGDTDFQQLAVMRAACDQHFAAFRLLHGLDGIANQVQQDLLYLHLVDQNKIMARIDLKSNPHAVLLGAHQRERARLLDQLLDALDAPLALAARDEIA